MNSQWKPGDLFTWSFHNVKRVYRVHRVRGTTIWYLRNCYGANPPRGILHSAHREEADKFWARVDRRSFDGW